MHDVSKVREVTEKFGLKSTDKEIDLSNQDNMRKVYGEIVSKRQKELFKIINTKPKSAKPTAPAADKPKAATNSSDKKSYTVRQGNSYKTFKTKSEAQTCAAQSKTKATITETTKKPTHKIVKFTARK